MRDWKRAATLPVSFFRQDAVAVARGLLGAVLVTSFEGRTTAGRIVEVEAYLGSTDPASHAYKLRRNRQNQSIYGDPGDWYVYRSYGVHWCANLVSGPSGVGAAVLIRALEPLEGLDVMRRRRGLASERLLCAGPGRLCQAMGITRALDGAMMRRSLAVVKSGGSLAPGIAVATPRVGISRGRDAPLRFVLGDSRFLSRPIRAEK
ncbi:MAG: DNA-3-methyladenine glycosylase [Gemmatimonadota bacterium]|nr:DNA-3-methyladenine glycosylase [Gemmatimonadota bacterium]